MGWFNILPIGTPLGEIGPVLRGGSSARSENEVQHPRLFVLLEKCLSTKHFSDNTARTPHVNLWRIVDIAEKELRWSIP